MKPLARRLDRVYIINLPSRPDRLASIKAELTLIGFDAVSDKIEVPFAPIMDDAQGWPSKGVLGNFLSHLEILRDASAKGHEWIMVLEDDAIFRHLLRDPAYQEQMIAAVEAYDWTLWYPGHAIAPADMPRTGPVAPSLAPFVGAHCYCVNGAHIDHLIDYLESTMNRERGHPDGAKMYIDGALNMYRNKFTDHLSLVSVPNLSMQKGSLSDLGKRKPYDSFAAGRRIASLIRGIRDEIWCRTGYKVL